MQYANQIGYSDVNPFEIIRKISEKTVEVREMKSERDPTSKMDFVPGGFFGTVVNQSDQKWIITSDPAGRIVRIRLGKKGWKDATGRRFQLADQPRKFYDYNF